ncbi:MAG TPA: hypothetical protein VFX35_12355 [Solirubrobacterales bacterium]|nr:hypothetical protein [Solirubrobacterales bacterium]
MKHLKMLGLAAMAIASVMAFSAASASATELYSGATTLPSGTTLTSSLSGTASLTTTSGTVLDTCTGGGVTGKTTTAGGGEKVNVVGSVEKAGVTWSGCTKTTDTLEGGTLEIAWKEGKNGTVTGKGFKVTVEMVAEFGGTCSYTLGTVGTNLGELKGVTGEKEHATLAINAIVNGASGNSFLCPADTKWVANYTVTSAKFTEMVGEVKKETTFTPVHATNS